jgi:hypothetical protein
VAGKGPESLAFQGKAKWQKWLTFCRRVSPGCLKQLTQPMLPIGRKSLISNQLFENEQILRKLKVSRAVAKKVNRLYQDETPPPTTDHQT